MGLAGAAKKTPGVFSPKGPEGAAQRRLPESFSLLALAAMLLPATAGCATRAMHLSNPLPLPGTSPETAEGLARRTLEGLQFELVYPEARPGHLETRPMVGASWFEFWRQDTIGSDQVLESSLHTIRRRAAVAVGPTEKGSEVAVTVVKERLSAPRQEPPPIGAGYSLYRSPSVPMDRPDELAAGRETWIEEGRDVRLEQEVLSRIYRQVRPGVPSR